ncbi:hypothetical protein NQ315_012051 [Exocentrus adspersus]|uniref:DUF4371 domain-containing protein n=1 Tax=Exocentrus adspersus TaxID=1586481 RepID=A0AAV8VI79_9CUCU|nr:hypothetical protein NQ315_012051 [Exocentrus adspersus]
MHRTKCTAIINNVTGTYFMQELKNDIESSPYSILIDESTDISVTKYLGVSIIYFSKPLSKIVTTCLGLWELETADAEGITNTILKVLARFNLRLANLQGIGVDNASVMVGVNTGVYQRLKAHCPNLILIKCICHSLQLAITAASKVLPRNLDFIIRETYDWFARSHSRQLAYKTLFATINEGHEPKKITRACETRWLSIESAVSRIFEQWLELKTHFGIARHRDNCYSAELLYNMYSDDCNYAYLCFLKPILKDVNRVNKCFESNNADPSKLLNDLLILLKDLVSKVTTPNSKFVLFRDNIEEYFDGNCYLGYLFEIQIKKMKESGFKQETELRGRCHSFLKILIKEITNRIPDNLKKTLRHQKFDITLILEQFNKKPDEIAQIDNQWRKIHLIDWVNTSDTNKFWVEVLNYKDSQGVVVFEELALFALALLTLPHSNAEVERLFSQMNLRFEKSDLAEYQFQLLATLLCAARSSIHRDTDERATHRSPPRAAAETKLYPPTDLLSGVFRWSAGFATEPAAQSPAKAQVYPGHSKAKEPVADQPLQRADVPSTRPGTDSEPVRKYTSLQVHVGVNPVVLLGFTVAVLSQYTRTLRRTNPFVFFQASTLGVNPVVLLGFTLAVLRRCLSP